MFGDNSSKVLKKCPIIVLDVHTTSEGRSETILIGERETIDGKPQVKKLSNMFQHAANIYRRARNGRRRAGGVI